MRKLSKILISVAAVLTLGFAVTPALPASAATNDEVEAIITRMVDKEDELFADSSDDPTEMAAILDKYEASLRQSVTDLNNVKATGEFRRKIDAVSGAISDMAKSVHDMSVALKGGDSTAYSTATSDFETATNSMQTAGEAYDAYLADHPLDSGDSQYTLWFGLLILSVVCLAGAIIMVAATRTQHGSVTNKQGKQVSLKDSRKLVLSGAVVFVIGAAIPAIQYWWGMHHPKADGTFEYYIFFWPLILGVIWFVLGLIQYLSTYVKVKKTGTLAHTDNAAEMASAGAGIEIPKIGSKIDKQ